MDTFTYPDPLLVAPGTFLIRHLRRTSGETLATHVNSLVVLGAEPLLIDAGTVAARATWLEQTFALVDPTEVRWVVVTHHGPDHVGNLVDVVRRCADARVVTSAPIRARLDDAVPLPAGRTVLVDGTGALELPDRRIVVVPPPVDDPDGSLGVFDATTRVLWAGDVFAAPVPGPVDDVAALPGWPAAFDRSGPWRTGVDRAGLADWIGRVTDLAPSVVASVRSPVVRGGAVDELLDRLGRS